MFEQLENYEPGYLESAIVDFYKKNHIQNPQDINLEMFAYDAGIWIHFLPQPSTNYHRKENMYSIVVDNRMPWQQQRVELAHELGHCLLHAGRQEFMADDFRVLQEWQADRFALYALAPTYMITNCITSVYSRQQFVSQLAYSFDLPDTFMDARLDLLEERMHSLVAQRQLAAAVKEATSGYDYSYRHPTNPRIEYLVKDHEIIGRRLRANI